MYVIWENAKVTVTESQETQCVKCAVILINGWVFFASHSCNAARCIGFSSSVCPSIACCYCIKASERASSQLDSAIYLVFCWCIIHQHIHKGLCLTQVLKQTGPQAWEYGCYLLTKAWFIYCSIGVLYATRDLTRCKQQSHHCTALVKN